MRIDVGRRLFAPLPREKFEVIALDPPWMYQKKPGIKGPKAAAPGAVDLHYQTLTPGQIATLDVPSIAADSAHIFMWTTNPQMFGGRFSDLTAKGMLDRWGFDFKTIITWVKTAANGEVHRGGPGWYFRGATEHIIYGTKGGASIQSGRRLPNVILATKSRHSEKPEEFFNMVEHCLPDTTKIELFARREREGWATWGNEV